MPASQTRYASTDSTHTFLSSSSEVSASSFSARAGNKMRGLSPASNRPRVVKSAMRVLEILELFSECQQSLSVNDVAQALDYPQSSTSMLLKSMHLMGYLELDRHGRTYCPTIRAIFLGGWVHDRLLSQSSLSSVMKELCKQTGYSVILAILNGVFVQYVHIAWPEISLAKLRPGFLRPVCYAATGKALLSAIGDKEVRRIVHHANAVRPDGMPPVDIERFLNELCESRRNGCALSDGTLTPGTSVVAVPLPISFGRIPAALGVALPIERLKEDQETIVELLKSAVKFNYSQATA
jgi:DNA-binding IclR family transcriptional regulator